MLTNSSSDNIPPSPPTCFFNTSLYPMVFSCFSESENIIHQFAYSIGYFVFVLPVSVIVLRIGFKQRSDKSSSSGQTSHTDVFTYYMAFMEMLHIVGIFFYLLFTLSCDVRLMTFGYFCMLFSSSAQTLINCLTCAERYLAVVHPIVYMKFKRSHGGVWIRNSCIVVAFLLNFGAAAFVAKTFPKFPGEYYFSVFVMVLTFVCFCSLSVFCMLIGSRRDHLKWRAFETIMAITVALMLRFCGQSISLIILELNLGAELKFCGNFFLGTWMCLPSSVIPFILFLHRNRKLKHLNCC